MAADPERERWSVLARHMSDLISTPGWDALMQQMDVYHQEQMEILLNSSAEVRDRIASFIKGMHHFRDYPLHLIAKVRQE